MTTAFQTIVSIEALATDQRYKQSHSISLGTLTVEEVEALVTAIKAFTKDAPPEPK